MFGKDRFVTTANCRRVFHPCPLEIVATECCSSNGRYHNAGYMSAVSTCLRVNFIFSQNELSLLAKSRLLEGRESGDKKPKQARQIA
jgi:hypothetical protein